MPQPDYQAPACSRIAGHLGGNRIHHRDNGWTVRCNFQKCTKRMNAIPCGASAATVGCLHQQNRSALQLAASPDGLPWAERVSLKCKAFFPVLLGQRLGD